MSDADLDYDLDQPVTMTRRQLMDFAMYAGRRTGPGQRGESKEESAAFVNCEHPPRIVGAFLVGLERFLANGCRIPEEGL